MRLRLIHRVVCLVRPAPLAFVLVLAASPLTGLRDEYCCSCLYYITFVKVSPLGGVGDQFGNRFFGEDTADDFTLVIGVIKLCLHLLVVVLFF